MISTKTLGVTLLAICLFLLDRILRTSRWIYYGYSNYATLTALPEGATRVTFQRALPATPGSHAVLYIPRIRATETHPFSLLSNKPAEFVVNARDGFTRSLHEKALASQGQKFRAAFEGPYGQPPAVLDFDRVLIIAGGSGATFCLSLALAWVRQPEHRKPGSSLTFVWAIKNKSESFGASSYLATYSLLTSSDYLQWFETELMELEACPAVHLIVHVTRTQGDVEQSSTDSDDEKNPKLESQQVDVRRSSSTDSSSLEKHILPGRPKISGIIGDVAGALPMEKRVLIAGKPMTLAEAIERPR